MGIPQIEPVKQVFERILTKPAVLPKVEIAEIERRFKQLPQEEGEEEKEPKRKRIPVIVFHEPVLPKPAEVLVPKFRIHHTREEVKGYLGKKGQKAELDRLMADIARIEMGEKPIKPLTDMAGFYTARVGGRRIIFQGLQEVDLSIITIGPRGTVYKRL